MLASSFLEYFDQMEQLYNLFLTSSGVTTDTRVCPRNSIFFALKGENFNGNTYAMEALDNGCSFAVIDDEKYAIDERIILVKDVLETLQELASYHRKHLGIPVIAITGTNGKTTTKELVNCVISSEFNCLATEGNLNNHIGVPLTLLKLTNEHQFAIIEMGANHIGEIDRLCQIAQPNYGLITNVGKAHLEGFGSFEGVMKAKGELYRYIENNYGQIFINSDNLILNSMAKSVSRIKYSTASQTGLVFCTTYNVNPFLEISFKTDGLVDIFTLKTNLIGSYNLENVLAAISIGITLKIEPNKIITSIENYTPSNNRSQLTKTTHNTILVDCYNANPSSMAVAIKNFIEIEANEKVLILGEMREMGDSSVEEHANLLALVANSNIQEVYLMGSEFLKVPNLNKAYKHYLTSEELKYTLEFEALKNKFILLKGSRGNKLEKLIEVL